MNLSLTLDYELYGNGSGDVFMDVIEPTKKLLTIFNKYDIKISVAGGGQNSQVDAIRQGIAKALVEVTGSDDLKKQFLDYDRSLIVADTRFKEMKKPNNSSARAKRQKSYRQSKMDEANKNFIKVKCHECGNEQTIFSRAATEIKCTKCSTVIAVPTGGKTFVKAEILELV